MKKIDITLDIEAGKYTVEEFLTENNQQGFTTDCLEDVADYVVSVLGGKRK